MTEKLILQKDRLLEIDTPVGSDVLFLTVLEGREEISAPFEFCLKLASKNSGIEPKDIIGHPVTATINQKNNHPKYVNGIINTWIKDSKDSQGIQRYQATIVPSFWFLKLSSSCEIFQNLTVSQIFSQICQVNGFCDFDISQLKKSYIAREYCVQYNETMFDFLNRLLEEEGIYYYFKHSKDKHIMILADQSSLASQIDEAIQYQNIYSWFSSEAVSTNRILTNDYNYATPSSDLNANANSSTKTKILQVTNLSKFYYPGCYQEKSESGNIVSKKIKAEDCAVNLINGSGNYLAFTPGSRFQLQDHEDKNQQGEYFLTKVYHSACDKTHLNQDQSASSQTYLNHFTCLSTKYDFLPKEKIKKPKILSVQSAVVVGPEDKTPHTNNMGRVKVKFFWNQNKENENLCWIRGCQPWGGATRGIQFMPRVGDEVLVSFNEGNPDRPIIIGSLYNGKNYSPYVLPAEQNKSGIRTRSVGVEFKENGHEIYFDDSINQEKFYIHATKDFNVTVKKNETINIIQNHSVAIEKAQTISAYKTLTYAAAQEIIFTAGNSQIIIKPSEININGLQVLLG